MQEAAEDGPSPQRVMVLGGPGAGKSTLARQLAERHGLPVHHLDRMYWRAGWVARDRADLEADLKEIVVQSRWVIDGVYRAAWSERVAAADTIVILDIPWPIRMQRIIRRSIVHRGSSRPDMAEGCEERMTLDFLWYAFNYGWRRRPKVMALAREATASCSVHIIRNKRDLEKILS